jgi:hypothetical protein
MVDEKHKDKGVEESKPRPKRPPGYRKFEKLLKQVVNAPPLRKHQVGLDTEP